VYGGDKPHPQPFPIITSEQIIIVIACLILITVMVIFWGLKKRREKVSWTSN